MNRVLIWERPPGTGQAGGAKYASPVAPVVTNERLTIELVRKEKSNEARSVLSVASTTD
jgi:hypothetical protein